MWYKLSIILGVFMFSVAQGIPLNEGFEGGAIPANWTVINNDSDSYKWETYYDTNYAYSGSWSARVHYNTQNDDWLITPELRVDLGDAFSFWARSYNSAYLENFNVLVSTTSNQIPSFTHTLDTLRQIPASYVQYAYPLDAYAGQSIYIAIQCVSKNKQYLFVDEIRGPNICLDNDIGVESIDAPADGASIEGDTLQPIKVTIANYGLLTQSNVPVILNITGSLGYSYADTEQTDTLEQDSTQQIIFDWLTPDVNENCNIKVWTKLVGDADPYNDTAGVNVTIYKKRSLLEGFEGGVIPANWTVINNDGDAYQWEAYQEPTYAHSGQWMARLHWNSNQNNDWLITPKLDVDSGDVFSFWARSLNSTYLEDFNVLVSTTTTQIPNFTHTLDTVRQIPASYLQYAYPLDAFAGQRIYIAIQCISRDEYYLFVDDVVGPPIWVPDNEVGIDTVYEPIDESYIEGDTLQPIKVTIANYGALTQFGIPVILKITGTGSYSQSDTQHIDSLEQDEARQIIFDWLTPDVSAMSCTVKVWTELPNDEDRHNDTAKIGVTVYRKGGLFEGFETDSIPDAWTVVDNDYNGYKWIAAKAPNFAHTGNWFATVHYSGSPNNDWLITPRLVVDTVDVLFFWARSRSSGYPEAFYVLVSKTTAAIDSFIDTLGKVTNVPLTYTQYSYPLLGYGGDSIYIAVQSTSTNGMYLDVDDFLGPKTLPPGVETNVNVPNSIAISQCFPNPMRMKTTIFYQLPKKTKVSIKIYNCAGLLVKTLIHKNIETGYYSVTWNGIDEKGKIMPSGIYFYKLESTNFSQTKKLILIR